MTNLTYETLFSTQTQPENERLALLKQHFPNCFDKHGAFLPDKLAEILHSDGIATQKEGYSLNWLGKSYARVLKDTPPETLLSEDVAHNQQPENANSENLLIKGDNLEVLKHLKHAYKNQIKMIYIDPPYNTGSDGFVYQDDRKFTPEQLAELGGMSLDEAKRVLEFTAKKSNSHSAWLTFMYPRLYVARELLHEDGVIFISIDDNELAQLKILCDEEVFGAEHFVGQWNWHKSATPPNLSKKIKKKIEYILCYQKKSNSLKFKGIKKESSSTDPLTKQENSLKELCFQAGSLVTKQKDGIIKAGRYGTNKYPNTLMNDLIVQNGTNLNEVRFQNKFVWTQEQLNAQLKANTAIYLSKDLVLSYKKAEYDEEVPPNFINEDVGVDTTEEAGKRLSEIFNTKEKMFSYPKPISLIQYMINFILADNHEMIVLDFFAGSGTTAHAVMEINAHSLNKLKFITVQLPENLDNASKRATGEAATILTNQINYLNLNHKSHNLFEITKARIELAAAKIRADNPDYSGDLGFKIFETVPLFDFQAALNDDFDPAQAEIPDSKNAMLSDEQLHMLLTTWRVHDGCRLPEKVQTVDLAGYTAYYCRHHLYLLASGFHSECVKALIEKLDNDKDFVPERIVLFSANMESAMQKELAQAVKTYANKKGLNNLSVLARV